jgi:tyrosyl-tRNA synthetase
VNSRELPLDQQLDFLTDGCVDVVRREELRARLERSRNEQRPLIVKVGFDPTAPDLHLGHTVVIRKMKHFQDLGHTAVFVVGDFTAMIGDPTGRSKTRPPLTHAEVAHNAETYKSQVFKLLDPDKTVVEFNSRWLSALGADGFIRLAARYNVAQMLERREFRQRFESRQPIAIHEFLYPLAQAYDSVELKADVELGGTDQLFNLNVGRDIMSDYGLEPQIVMTTPLLEGLDGAEKMSKSLGNYIAVRDAPEEMFGKLMSISDELMWRYYTVLTDVGTAGVSELRSGVASGALHPKQVKMELARRVVAECHDRLAADRAAAEFDRVHGRRELPEALRDVVVPFPEVSKPLARVIAEAGLASSSTEAARKIEQGGVRLDDVRCVDPRRRLTPAELPMILRVGRHVVRLVASSAGASAAS